MHLSEPEKEVDAEVTGALFFLLQGASDMSRLTGKRKAGMCFPRSTDDGQGDAVYAPRSIRSMLNLLTRQDLLWVCDQTFAKTAKLLCGSA